MKYILLTLVVCLYTRCCMYDKQIMKNYYNNKKVLVTGGCGFIGSHLVEKLVHYGARVTILDDLSTGSLENISFVRDRVTFIQGSITDIATCRQATQGVSHVFHLAACVSVAQSIKDPRTCHEVNVNGTFNMLEAAAHTGVARFVFSSSAAVYGMPKETCTEDMKCNPISPYGYSKLIGEQLCQQWQQSHGIQTISLRYFNVFGERQNPHGQYAAVVATFTNCMHTNKPITIYGDGLQTRDFIPVQQVVDANLLVGMAPKNLLDHPILNVATGNSITLLELINQLKKNYPDYHLPVTFLPARPGDIRYSTADRTRINKLLKQFRMRSEPY